MDDSDITWSDTVPSSEGHNDDDVVRRRESIRFEAKVSVPSRLFGNVARRLDHVVERLDHTGPLDSDDHVGSGLFSVIPEDQYLIAVRACWTRQRLCEEDLQIGRGPQHKREDEDKQATAQRSKNGIAYFG